MSKIKKETEFCLLQRQSMRPLYFSLGLIKFFTIHKK